MPGVSISCRKYKIFPYHMKDSPRTSHIFSDLMSNLKTPAIQWRIERTPTSIYFKEILDWGKKKWKEKASVSPTDWSIWELLIWQLSQGAGWEKWVGSFGELKWFQPVLRLLFSLSFDFGKSTCFLQGQHCVSAQKPSSTATVVGSCSCSQFWFSFFFFFCLTF